MKELVFHLKDSGAEVIVTEKRFLNVVRQAAEEAGLDSSRILVMGEDKEGLGKVKTIEDVIVREDERMKQEKLDVEKDLAFLVYSSGTTGVSHVALSSSLVLCFSFLLFESQLICKAS